MVFPGANHTRFEHSLGVYDLAGRMCEALELDADAVREIAQGLHLLDGPVIRRHAAEGIAGDIAPVVAAGAAGAGTLHIALLHEDHLRPVPRGGDGGPAARDAAAQHQHVGFQLRLLTELDGIGPFRRRAGLVQVIMPGSHYSTSFVRIFARRLGYLKRL